MVQDFEGNLLLDKRITFGGVAGCGLFGRPADAWKEIMEQEFDLVHIFRWVDDNLFVRNPASKTTMAEVVKRSAQLGIKTNEKKYSKFANQQKFIGLLWDGQTRTVQLPPGKQEEQLHQVEEFLEPEAHFSYKDALVLAGRLNHVTYILPQLRCYMRSIYHWQKEWHNLSVKRPISNKMRINLEWWRKALAEYRPTRLIPDQRRLGRGRIHFLRDRDTHRETMGTI
jgi:hypothetical protein